MAVLNRDAVKLPALPKQTHPFPPLGGEVVVRSLLLKERIALSRTGAAALQFEEFVPRLLAATVVDDKGQQLLDEEGWNHIGAIKDNTEHVLALFGVACTLCGFDLAGEKKDS